jgi:hypothetical protein
MESDPLVQLLKNRLDILILLGKMWDILYIEGSTPDIGIKKAASHTYYARRRAWTKGYAICSFRA